MTGEKGQGGEGASTRTVQRGAGGKIIKDVHYTADGFRLLGERFAKKAIELIKKSYPNNAP